MEPNVFVSNDKTKYVCVVGDSPSFTRRSHTELLKANGVDIDKAENLTVDFYYKGKGQSIKNFLENN